jgi:hypothetical protein
MAAQAAFCIFHSLTLIYQGEGGGKYKKSDTKWRIYLKAYPFGNAELQARQSFSRSNKWLHEQPFKVIEGSITKEIILHPGDSEQKSHTAY